MHVVEYLVTIAALALAVATALVHVAGPDLVRAYHASERAAASPIP